MTVPESRVANALPEAPRGSPPPSARTGRLIGLEDITPAWLTDVLVRAGTLITGRVVDCRTEALTGPSFTGSFKRVVLTYDQRPAGAPASLVAKASSTDPEQRAALHSMGFYLREALFYRELAPTTPVPVPRCHFADVNTRDGHSLLLLDDLTGCRRGRSLDPLSPADTRLAVDTIARVHAHWWEHPRLNQEPLLNPESCIPINEITKGFVDSWPTFLAKLSIPISDDILRLGDIIAANLDSSLVELFSSRPLTLIHHDFQGDNLVFGVGDTRASMRVIDWQLAMRGRGIIDLAYLLSGSLQPRDRARAEAGLFPHYVGRLAGEGCSYTAEQARADYRLALLLPPSRLAMAVAATPSLTAHPGAFWDVLFQRQLRAVFDNW